MLGNKTFGGSGFAAPQQGARAESLRRAGERRQGQTTAVLSCALLKVANSSALHTHTHWTALSGALILRVQESASGLRSQVTAAGMLGPTEACVR
jgi:hypothetical protein